MERKVAIGWTLELLKKRVNEYLAEGWYVDSEVYRSQPFTLGGTGRGLAPPKTLQSFKQRLVRFESAHEYAKYMKDKQDAKDKDT